MTTVFLNGQFVTRDKARVSAFDAGLQHGVGLFETILGGCAGEPPSRPWAFRLEDHLDRLIDSARVLGLGETFRAPALAQAVLATIERSELPLARVRLTLTGGDLNLLERARIERAGSAAGQGASAAGSAPAPGLDPTVMIVAQPATEYPPEFFERGVIASIADFKLNPLDASAGHKTTNYWMRLRELQIAASKRAGEALVFQVTNFLAGGCVSNAVVVKDGVMLTPLARGEEEASPAKGVVTPSPVLPGVTRGWVMDWARQERLSAQKRLVSIKDVLEADEVLLTNSSWGVLPVVQVEQQKIGTGKPGPMTTKLMHAWTAALDEAAEA
jgi:branched-chain amino acid aminotransferase